jgi:hypothetical protein
MRTVIAVGLVAAIQADFLTFDPSDDRCQLDTMLSGAVALEVIP